MRRVFIIPMVALASSWMEGCGRTDPMPGRHVLAVNAWTPGRVTSIDFDRSGRGISSPIKLPIRAPITQLTTVDTRLLGLVPHWLGDETAGLYEIDIKQRKLRLIANLSEYRDHGGLVARNGKLWTLVRAGLIVHDLDSGQTNLIPTGPVQTQMGLASTEASIVFLSAEGRLLRCDPETQATSELVPGAGARFSFIAGSLQNVLMVDEGTGSSARLSIIRDPHVSASVAWPSRIPATSVPGGLIIDGHDAWMLYTQDLSDSTTMIRISDGRRASAPTWILSGVAVPD